MALGTVLATAALTAPAVAQETPIITASLTGDATLVAKGAAVDVRVLYSCSSDATSALISVSLTQRVAGGRLAKGSAFTRDLVCDGAERTATVRVIGDAIAFKKGDAAAQGSMEACISFCSFVALSGTVRVR
ncbi:hypothetical protein OG558_12350 [Kribbella sp. NBC_01510]|uniref:hypothetical protein n=1 Tax=Kribbella sp. NBC_01510 TaxID=2903581 RepID=UPI00386BFA6F